MNNNIVSFVTMLRSLDCSFLTIFSFCTKRFLDAPCDMATESYANKHFTLSKIFYLCMNELPPFRFSLWLLDKLSKMYTAYTFCISKLHFCTGNLLGSNVCSKLTLVTVQHFVFWNPLQCVLIETLSSVPAVFTGPVNLYFDTTFKTLGKTWVIFQ